MESLEHNNQSWTKMLRKMDVTMSSFKIKLLKALLTTNTPPPPPPSKKMLKSDWIISHPDKTSLTRVGQEKGT